MLEIEYELTLDDELDGYLAVRKYTTNLPLLHWQIEYIFSLTFIAGSLFLPLLGYWLELYYESWVSFELLVFGILALPQVKARSIWKLTSWTCISQIKSPWRENPNMVKGRKVVANEQEFSFSQNDPYLCFDETITEVYSWERLKYFFIAEKSIILEFTSEKKFSERKQRFIPRRVLTEGQLQELASYAKQHGTQLGQKKKS